MEQLTLFAADTPANLSPQPGSGEARKMTATSGRNLVGSWLNSGPLGSLERTLLGTSAWVSMTCFLTWKSKVTPAGRLLFQLAPSVPRTEGTEFGLWRTPSCGMVNQARSKDPNYGQRLIDKGQTLTLAAQVINKNLWPNPRAKDAKKRGNIANDPRNGLPEAARWWPTPTTRDHKGGRKPDTLQASGRGETNSLNDAVTIRDQHGALNPEWVEWLMGFPVGWTNLESE